MSEKKLGKNETIVTIVGMLCLLGIALIAGLVFHIDGYVLLGTGLAIVGLANTDLLKLLLKYVPIKKQS